MRKEDLSIDTTFDPCQSSRTVPLMYLSRRWMLWASCSVEKHQKLADFLFLDLSSALLLAHYTQRWPTSKIEHLSSKNGCTGLLVHKYVNTSGVLPLGNWSASFPPFAFFTKRTHLDFRVIPILLKTHCTFLLWLPYKITNEKNWQIFSYFPRNCSVYICRYV